MHSVESVLGNSTVSEAGKRQVSAYGRPHSTDLLNAGCDVRAHGGITSFRPVKFSDASVLVC